MQEANLGNMKFVRDGDQNLKASHLTIYFSFTPLSPHCYTVATLEGLTHISWLTVPPQIVTRPQNKTINETDVLSLFCNATGHPLPTVSWSKDGVSIAFSNKQTLKIQNVTRKAVGVYMCSASNGVSAPDNASALVLVNCECLQVVQRCTNRLKSAATATNYK